MKDGLVLGAALLASAIVASGVSCADLELVGGVGGAGGGASGHASSGASGASTSSGSSASTTSTSSGVGGPTLLVGSSDVVPTATDGGEDDIEYGTGYQPGTGLAALYTAVATGVVGHLWIYLFDSPSTSIIDMGLYTDANGDPGSLLGGATLNDATAGWNEVVFTPAQAPVTVTTGTRYWIAGLAPAVTANAGDDLSFGYHVTSGTAYWQQSLSSKLTALPATWTPPSPTKKGAEGSESLYQLYASE